MDYFLTLAKLISLGSFLFFGTACLLSSNMVAEFERYHLAKYRKITGILQIIASIGFMLGFFFPLLTFVSSLGLSLQMLLGIGVRIRIGDSLLLSFPAIFYFLLNLFIFLNMLMESQ